MTTPQHRSVLAPAATTIPSSKIPPTTGTIALCPESHRTYQSYSSSLLEALDGESADFGPLSQDTVGLIWLDSGGAPAAAKLGEVLRQYPQSRWVQLGLAGVNAFEGLIKANKEIVWTSAKVGKTTLNSTQPSAARHDWY